MVVETPTLPVPGRAIREHDIRVSLTEYTLMSQSLFNKNKYI
jgi:hypothetical protein